MTRPTFIERRRPAFTGEFVLRATLAWALIAVLLLVTGYPFIRDQIFGGPDDVLRLVQVRDLIAGQSWFDLTQYRIDAPNGGIAMHWSRLVDIPLLLVITALTPLIGSGTAETLALVLVPLFTLYCAAVLTSRIAWRLLGIELVTLACLALALSVPVLSQMRPMRIDHHGWQIVLALVAVNGLLARKPRVGGWVIGASLAAWLAISVEGLPFAVACCAILALRWIVDRREGEGFVAAMTGLAVGSVALFMTMRGAQDLAAYCDALSPWHVGVFCFGALSAGILQRFEPMPRAALLAGLAVIAGGGVAILLLAAPQCATGGFAAVDPLVADVWLANVPEGQPLWTHSLSDILQVLIPCGVGLIAAINLAVKNHDRLRRVWFEYAALLAAAIIIATFISRAGAVAGALAAAPLAWQIELWLRRVRNIRPEKKKVPSLALVVMIGAVPLIAGALFLRSEPAGAEGAAAVTVQAALRASDCHVAGTAPVLSALAKGEVFAPLDLGPAILHSSKHTVVATGHHRADGAIRDTIEIFTGSSSDAHARLLARRAAYVAYCPGLAETARLAAAYPEGFAAEMESGKVPDWLEPVKSSANGPTRIWRVIPRP